MKKFKYTIFDLDGTLLDSMAVWRNLGKEYLLHKGIVPPNNLNEIIAAMSLEESAEYFQKVFKLDLSIEEIVEDIKKLIEDKYKYDFKLKPCVKEYLQKLKDENVVMCIATATSLNLAKAALERNGVLNLFSFVISCDEVGISKDRPDIFLLAANKLNKEPSEIAVYEDADFALITAKEAGFYTIGVYDETFKDKKIEKICDMYIKSFKELL